MEHQNTNMLGALEEECEQVETQLMVLEDKGRWTKIMATVDSGAAEHVMPIGMLPRVTAVKSENPKKYVTADGGRLQDGGSKKVQFTTQRGAQRIITFRAIGVMKPLVSTCKLVKTGHRVVMEGDSPRIECPNGDVIPIKEMNGVYTLEMWIDTAIYGPVFSRPV